MLMVIYETLGKPERCVLCFDGLMIPRNHEADLVKCEKAVADALGINIKLVIKPMSEGFDEALFQAMSPDKKEDVAKKMIGMLLDDNVNDSNIADCFYMLMGDDIITINEAGDGYIWDETNCIWKPTNSSALVLKVGVLKNVVENVLEHFREKQLHAKNANEVKFYTLKVKNTIDIRNRIQSARGARDCWTFAKDLFLNENFENTLNRNHDLLPIKHKLVIDLRTRATRARTKEDMFSLECPVEFITADKRTDDDRRGLAKFVEPILMRNKEYIDYWQIKLGSYLSGRINRDIDINHGDGKNGKSLLMTALSTILGEFFGYIGKNVVVCDVRAQKKDNAGNHTSHLMPIKNKRLVSVQEITDDGKIHSDMVKKIASNDPIEGVREVYGRKTTTLTPMCKLMIINTNHIPKFDSTDNAVIDRLVLNPFNSRFLTKTALNEEKDSGRYDTAEYNYEIADVDIVDNYNKEGRYINVLFSWMIEGCMKYYQCSDGGIEKPALVKKYINAKITENDVVATWASFRCEVISAYNWKNMDKESKRNYSTSSMELFEDFVRWGKNNGCLAGQTQKAFNKRLKLLADFKKTMKGV